LCESSRLPHFLETIGSHMAVSLSALHTGRLVPPGIFLVLIFVTGCVDPNAAGMFRSVGKNQ
jgi:hypothetical protein